MSTKAKRAVAVAICLATGYGLSGIIFSQPPAKVAGKIVAAMSGVAAMYLVRRIPYRG